MAKGTSLGLHGVHGVHWCSMAMLGSPASGSVLPLASPASWPPSLAPAMPMPYPDSISYLSKDQAGQQVSVPVAGAEELGFVLLILMVKHRHGSV